MSALEPHAGKRLGTLVGDWVAVPPAAERAVVGLTLDSRLVRPGFAFVALAGTRQHGLAFVDDALQQGAVAVLADAAEVADRAGIREQVERRGATLVAVPALANVLGTIAARFHDHPSAQLERIYAVTGTDGKTSVAHFVAAMRQTPQRPVGLVGTLGSGMAGRIRHSGLTTPDAPAFQEALAGLVALGCREAALEASSHGLAQYRLDGTRIDVAILTYLGRDHLDYHDSQASYAAAKARLFDWPGLAAAVINLDDAFGRQLLGRIRPQVRRIGYTRGRGGEAPDGTLTAEGFQPGPDGFRFRLRWRDRVQAVTLPLLGEFNADNAVAASAAVLAAGASFDEVLSGLERIQPVPGRMEMFRGPSGPGIVVDYAHNAGALAGAIQALRRHADRRIWCVFGAGGDRDRGKRPLMAAAAAAADRVIVTDDNPRGEEPAAIVADIVQGFPAGTDYAIEHDRKRALEQAWSEAAVGDWILLAGKGHETHQARAAETIPWSDREAAAALTGRPLEGAP